MSRLSLESLHFTLPELDIDVHNLDPLTLMKEASNFQPPGVGSRLEPSSLNFDNVFDKVNMPRPGDSSFHISSPFDVPNPLDALRFTSGDTNFSTAAMKNPLSSDGILSGNFGDAFGHLSNLFSSPDNLTKNGLFGGAEDIGGVLGHITNPVNSLFSSLGDIGGKVGGVLGSIGNFLGPIGGVVGGIMGSGQEGIKGLLSSVASGFSFGGPIGAGVMGLAHITGLDKLAGKAIGGLVDGVKTVGSAIGHGIVDGVKTVGSAIGSGISAIGSGLKHLFGF